MASAVASLSSRYSYLSLYATHALGTHTSGPISSGRSPLCDQSVVEGSNILLWRILILIHKDISRAILGVHYAACDKLILTYATHCIPKACDRGGHARGSGLYMHGVDRWQ